MLSRIVEHFLSKYFEEIFYGINHKNIHTKLLDGKLLIQNIGLQKEFIQKLNLPIELKASFVQKLSLEFAWRKENSNLKISIESIYAIVVDKYYNDQKILENLKKGKEKVVKDALKEFANRLKEAKDSAENKEQSAFEKYLLKQLDNIELHIGFIHLRYQNQSDRFSFGLTINDILLETRDHENKKAYFDREKTHQSFVRQVLQIGRFGIYWNSNQRNMLSEMNHSKITEYMLQRHHSNQLIEGPGDLNRFHLNYIFTLTIFVTLKKLIAQNGRDPEIEGTINIEETNCKVSQVEYSQVATIVKYFLSHQSRVKDIIQARQMQNHKPKGAKEILNLMKQTYHTEETRKYMQKNIRDYLTWTFTEIQERVIKKRFIDTILSIHKKVTPESILKTPRLLRIIHKTQNQKLKQWLFQALKSRIDKEENSPFLIRKDHDFLTTTRRAFSKLANVEKHGMVNENYVWLKLSGTLKKAKFQIAERSGLGLNFSFHGVQLELNLRNTNFYIEMEINDVSLVLFNDPSVNRAETSILRKNTISHEPEATLMKVRFEKNPINKPYVFAEMEFQFRSIQVNIFPSTIKELYTLFTSGIINTKHQHHTKLKKSLSKPLKQQNDYQAIRSSGFQKNIINARIHSPWIIMPLSRINDSSSECWVIRLGDLQVNTPNEPDSKQQLYYQKYNVMLQNFQLKYFSSIKFFYNWLKFKNSPNQNKLFDSGLIQNGKIIQIIKPFSCQIHAKTLKKFLSTSVDSTVNYKIRVKIQEIQLNISTFIILKLKKLFQDLQKGESQVPIQLDRDVIFRASKFQQSVIVNYKEFENFRFYVIYHGGYFYLFLNENSLVHSFIIPYVEIRVVLRSFQSEKSSTLNQGMETEIEIFFDLHGEMLRWKQFLEAQAYHLSKPKEKSNNHISSIEQEHQNHSKMKASQYDIKQPSDKYSITCQMPKLSFKFIDQNEIQFLNGVLGEMEFRIEQKFCREVIVTLNQFMIDGPTFEELPMLFSSEECGASEMVSSTIPRNKFMQVQIKFDEFTNKLREINMKFKRLIVAWKVELIQRILTFFNIDIESGPSLPNKAVKKREITIKAAMESWDLIMINKHYIFAQVKLSDVLIGYSSANQREVYSFKGKIEFYGMLDNDLNRLYPVFTIRKDTNILPKFELNYTSGSLETLEQTMTRGKSVLSAYPSLKITVEGYQLVYVHQFFNRLFNYTLNKFIGSITSKFRIKKDYSPQYIFQTLKIRKPSTFDIIMNNLTVVFPGDINEGYQKLLLSTKRITISRNLDSSFPLQPKQFPSKKDNIVVNYEKMIVTCRDAELFYINEKKKEKIPVIEGIIGFQIQYNKFNLSKDYFPILRDVKEFDLTANVVVTFEFPVEIQLQKSVFLQILRTYYRNMKQKDGLALEYEPASLHPTPRVYTLNIPGFRISFLQENQSKFSKYFTVTLPFLKVTARELRSQISALISTECLFAQYYDNGWNTMIQPLDTSNCPTKIEMKSSSGDVSAQIKLSGLSIMGDLNQLNNIIDFVDFDPSDADNQRMPKKPRKSFQNFKIFIKDSIIGFQSGGKLLEVKGIFFIDYSKNPQGILDEQVKQIFGQTVTHSQVNEKDIKVNAQDIEIIFNSIKMSQLPNVMYRRHEFTNRVAGKKLRREFIFLQQFLLCLNTSMITQFQKLYKRRLKKDTKTKKSYFDANSVWTPKRKYDEKRKYNVSSEPINFILLGKPLHKSIQPIINLRIQILELIAVLVNSVPESVSAIINTSIWNKGYKLDFLELINAYNICVNFQNQENSKKITLSGNTIKINGFNIHQQVINKLLAIKDSFHIASISKQTSIQFKNDTDLKVKVSLKEKNEDSIVETTINVFQEETVEISQLDFCKLYMGGMELVLGIHHQTFVLDLGEIQMNKLFNIGNLLFLVITYNDKEDIVVQFETKFRLQNLTNYRYQYSLMSEGKNKSKGVLYERKNINFNFEQGDTLHLREETSKQEISLDLKKTFKKFNNFNISLDLENKAVYVCKIHPKVLIHNEMPMAITFSNMKHHIEIPAFSTKEFPIQKYFDKKEIILTINQENYRSETSFFKQNKAVLELISPSKEAQKLNINFSTKEGNSLEWRFQSSLILLNASYHNLTIKNNLKINHLSTITLNHEESLRLGSVEVTPSSIKPYVEKEISSLLTLQMLIIPQSKTPILVFNPQVLFINQSSSDIILNNKYRINKNQALPLQENPQSIPLSINSVTDKTLRNIDFSTKPQFNFFIKNQKLKQNLKITLNKFDIRSVIVLENSNDHYILKNSLTGFTLVIKQRGEKCFQEFTVRENSESVFSMEDPLGEEIFQVEFYLNSKNKEFQEKLVVNIVDQEPYREFRINEQNQRFSFEVSLKKVSKGVVITVASSEESKAKAKQQLELNVKHLTLTLAFQPDHHSQQLIVDLTKLYFKRQKHNQTEKYSGSIDSLDIRYRDLWIMKKNKPGSLLEFQCTMNKWNKLNEFPSVTAKCNSIILNLKEDIVLEICNILKNIHLISDKKLTFNREKGELVLELLKGNIGLNEFKNLSMKYYKKSNTPKTSKQLAIDQMRIHPISINLSYMKKTNNRFNEFKDHPFLKYLIILPDIRQLKVELPELVVERYRGDQKGLKKKITSHVKKSIPNHIFSSINSLSLFESPVDAMDMIGNLIDALWFKRE